MISLVSPLPRDPKAVPRGLCVVVAQISIDEPCDRIMVYDFFIMNRDQVRIRVRPCSSVQALEDRSTAWVECSDSREPGKGKKHTKKHQKHHFLMICVPTSAMDQAHPNKYPSRYRASRSGKRLIGTFTGHGHGLRPSQAKPSTTRRTCCRMFLFNISQVYAGLSD